MTNKFLDVLMFSDVLTGQPTINKKFISKVTVKNRGGYTNEF